MAGPAPTQQEKLFFILDDLNEHLQGLLTALPSSMKDAIPAPWNHHLTILSQVSVDDIRYSLSARFAAKRHADGLHRHPGGPKIHLADLSPGSQIIWRTLSGYCIHLAYSPDAEFRVAYQVSTFQVSTFQLSVPNFPTFLPPWEVLNENRDKLSLSGQYLNGPEEFTPSTPCSNAYYAHTVPSYAGMPYLNVPNV